MVRLEYFHNLGELIYSMLQCWIKYAAIPYLLNRII